MMNETNALKEWASVVDAVGNGDQLVLIRKGGLADRNFGFSASRFLLAPTYLHQTENRFRAEFAHYVDATTSRHDDAAELEFSVWCEIVASAATRDVDAVLRLENEVIFGAETIRERYAFRPEQALYVVLVRAWRLPSVVTIENKRKYGGCKSWLTLDDSIALDGSSQVVPDDTLQRRQAAIEQLLGLAMSSAVVAS